MPLHQQRCRSHSKCRGILARMGVFVCWQAEGCGNNCGFINVLEMTTVRAGGKQLDENGHGEDKDALMRQWQCCCAVDGSMRGGGQT
jgi:hypothetical protein